MKRKHKKKLNQIYKIYCEVDNWWDFEKRLLNQYEDEIISWMWDFFLSFDTRYY